jgi:hypothetical protein
MVIRRGNSGKRHKAKSKWETEAAAGEIRSYYGNTVSKQGSPSGRQHYVELGI